MRAVQLGFMMFTLGIALAAGCSIEPAGGGGGGGGGGQLDETDDQDDSQISDGDGQENDNSTTESGIVAQWDFEPVGMLLVGSLVPSNVASHVTASDFTSSDGSPTTTAGQGFNWLTEGGWTDEGTFLSCTIQAEDGCEITLTSLEFEQASLHETGPTTWQLRSSADGFAADLATGSVPLFPDFASHAIELTGITVGQEPVEFRWLASGATGPNVGWGLDNVTFSGDVVTTE
ncbi:MAG: hypothetical protein JXB13_18985 [Phycisphaerae bacterium]|nr:hypothetical protein [Phycisphaerae bacterium]